MKIMLMLSVFLVFTTGCASTLPNLEPGIYVPGDK